MIIILYHVRLQHMFSPTYSRGNDTEIIFKLNSKIETLRIQIIVTCVTTGIVMRKVQMERKDAK